MLRRTLPWFLILVGWIACQTLAWNPPLYGQGSKLGLSPADQKKYDDLIRSAKRNEMIGYIAAGAAIFFIVAAIPLSIYFDRRKKARQMAAQAQGKAPGGASPPNERGSPGR